MQENITKEQEVPQTLQRRLQNNFGGNNDLAAFIVPFLPQLTDVVTLYSSSSSLRDVVAPEMLKQLSLERWKDTKQQHQDENENRNVANNVPTTSMMIEHLFKYGSQSAALTNIKHVDISAKFDASILVNSIGKTTNQQPGGNNNNNSSFSPDEYASSRHSVQAAKTFSSSQYSPFSQLSGSPSRNIIFETVPLDDNIDSVAVRNNTTATSSSSPNNIRNSRIQSATQSVLFGIDTTTTSATTRKRNVNSLFTSTVKSTNTSSNQISLSDNNNNFTLNNDDEVASNFFFSSPDSSDFHDSHDSSSSPSRFLTNAIVTDKEFVQISKWCHNLETLIADRCAITDTGLYHASVCLARNIHFKNLSLRGCLNLTSLSGLKLLGKNLRSLDVSLCPNIFTTSIQPLSELSDTLEELYFVRCRNLNNIDVLASCLKLQKLDITACPVKDISALGDLPSLKWLRADECKQLFTLSQLGENSKSLEWISLRSIPAPAETELIHLAKIPTLQHLCVYNANVEQQDGQFEFLNEFSSISSLDVGGLRIRTCDLSGLGKMERLSMRFCPVVETFLIQKLWSDSLKFLDLSNCQLLQDDGVDLLQNLQQLTFLSLAGTSITDKTVEESILKLQNLVELDLSNTMIRNIGKFISSSSSSSSQAQEQQQLDQLRKLNLECCRGISEKSLIGLENLPKLEELNISCTSVRDLSFFVEKHNNNSSSSSQNNNNININNWNSLKILRVCGLLYCPRKFVEFCLKCCPQLEYIDVTSNSNSNNMFLEAAAEIKAAKYIWIEGTCEFVAREEIKEKLKAQKKEEAGEILRELFHM